MPRVVALDLPGGPGFVAALEDVWSAGDAAFVLDRRLPPPARAAALAAAAPALVIDEGGPHRLDGGRGCDEGDALVVTTSGTTGVPKAVVLTHDAVAASARASSARLGTGPHDHWLACLPLAHVGGLSVVCRALVTGARLTVHPGFDPAAVAEAARAGVTVTSLVATALRRVDPTAFRAILLGGAAPPEDIPPNAVVTYGMTETGSGVVYDGQPLDGVEVRLDADGGILLRGPMLLRCYRDGTDPKQDGWLATGDVGTLGPDGRVRVFGRRGDLIVTGGENVWPDAVEAVIARVRGVAEVAVAGVPDEEWGHRVVAFVVPSDPGAPPRLAEVRAAVKAELAAHAAPKDLVLVGSLPRTALGKVRRSALVTEPPGASAAEGFQPDQTGSASAGIRLHRTAPRTSG